MSEKNTKPANQAAPSDTQAPAAETKAPAFDPAKVDPEKVKARVAEMVKYGTDPLHAEKLAYDAEAAQQVRDAQFKVRAEARTKAQAESKKGGN